MHIFQEAVATEGTFLHRLFKTMEADNVQFHIAEPVGENETVVGKMNLLERSAHTIFREAVKEKKVINERLKEVNGSEASLHLLKKDDYTQWQRLAAEILLNESIHKRFPQYSEVSVRAPNLIVAHKE
ncbi:MAG: hypothetical protein K9M12_01390 [Candidatus Pacebacteria bacterium]|nr:hypothetical protein [Candidatus Paceibacterota bacterium]